MKKIYKRSIEEAIKTNKATYGWQKFLLRDVLFDSVFRFLFVFLFLVYSLLNYDKLAKLSKLTADTILNHEVLINTEAYYFVWIFVLVAICFIAFSISFILLRVLKKDYLKKIYFYYKLYDILNFIATIFVIINFIIMYVITPVTVDGSSMNKTLYSGDKVLLWHFGYEAENDDIIVFDAKKYNYYSNEVFYIKRVVASPNDLIIYQNQKLYNGSEVVCNKLNLTEWTNITKSLNLSSDVREIKIPNNRYIVLGDNRANSTDSRSFGAIYQDDIIGKAFLRYWPFSDFGIPKKNILEG